MIRAAIAVLVGFGVLGLSSISTVQAATLYLDPPTSSLERGDAISLALRLDVDEAMGECVNAADVVISYPQGIEPVDTSIGSSIFRVWVEEPTIDRETRTITLAGGIPNGYCGRIDGDPRLTNVLAELIFRSPGFVVGSNAGAGGEATIAIEPKSAVYLNDGRGTAASLTTYPATLTLNPQRATSVQNPWQDRVDADNTPPEEFSIALEQQAGSDKYFIVFGTQDKQTGIDQYQVMEQPLSTLGSFEWGEADAPWMTTRSPYILEDQTLNSVIRVRALDKAGNEYIATLVPDESLRTTSANQVLFYSMLAAGVILLVAVGIVGVVWWRRRRQQQNQEPTDEADPEGFTDSDTPEDAEQDEYA